MFSFVSELCLFFKNQIVIFWVCLLTFSCFCSFVFRFKSSLQKNNLSSSKLVLIQFAYHGFSFMGHAVRL